MSAACLFLIVLNLYCLSCGYDGMQVLDGMGISSEKLNIEMFDEVKVRTARHDGSFCV